VGRRGGVGAVGGGAGGAGGGGVGLVGARVGSAASGFHVASAR